VAFYEEQERLIINLLTRMSRVIAIDWSGRATREHRTIWIAEADESGLLFLENGRTRAEVVEWLITERRKGEPMFVGLDFAFSLPAEYLNKNGHASAPVFWERLHSGHAEDLLRRCEPPFWGRPGKRRPVNGCEFRRTEEQVATVDGIRPKSVFQIGGAGAVGTGSLRGMPALHRLREAGFAVWPFMAASESTVVEIYPRILTGSVRKSNKDERARYLERRWPAMPPTLKGVAASTEDAFDAAVSVLVMWHHRDELAALPTELSAVEALEGLIWAPVSLGSRPPR
jgi:hypothetical protein